MTTLIEAMLESARLMGVVVEGDATGGSTTTLVDSLLTQPAGYFTGGTLWALNGTNAGLCNVVNMYNEGTITLTGTLSAAIAAGDDYALATNEYPKNKLKQAVLAALRNAPILKTNDVLVVTASTQEYTIPTGVSNIKRAEVATSTGVPYGFVPNHFWREWNGKLIFESGYEPSQTGLIIRLWYEGAHGEIGETGTILSSVDMNWLKWSAAAFLYRDQLKKIQKDNPTNIDLMNEARGLEAEAKRTAKRYLLTTMQSDTKLAGW